MSTDSSARVREFFDSHAGSWDEMHESFYDETVVDALAERSALGGHVVDVGTGTGFVAGGLAAQAASVTGIDSSAAMLAQARVNLRGLGIDNVALVEAEVDRLPLGDATAEAAVANMVLHHATDPVAMLREMARVVRPGGSVAIADCVEHPHEWLREEQADVWLGFSAETIARYFEAAGLTDVEYRSLGTA